jgi:hypothetical protein
MKWRKRAFLYDAPMGPKVPRSTVLSAEEEALAVAFRKHTLLPLDVIRHKVQPRTHRQQAEQDNIRRACYVDDRGLPRK